jgi:hypothetical protein
MCWPVAHAFMRLTLAVFRCIAKWKSCIETLPAAAPAPPPCAAAPTLLSPQLQDWMSISSLCLSSALSPLMPSNLMK